MFYKNIIIDHSIIGTSVSYDFYARYITVVSMAWSQILNARYLPNSPGHFLKDLRSIRVQVVNGLAIAVNLLS